MDNAIDFTTNRDAAALPEPTPAAPPALSAPDLATATVDAAQLAQMLDCCTKSIERAVRRDELPRPFKFMGRNRWMRTTILAHLEKRQAAALAKQNKLPVI
jgi:hypothetical protein